MKRWLVLPLLGAVILAAGCREEPTENPQSCYLQEVAHLYPDAAIKAEPALPLNYEEVRAVWIPVTQYQEWMTGQNEAQFRENVRTAFRNCTDLGINTLYLHVRAYGDAYYDSALFPRGSYLDGDYDPLAIMLEEAHALALSVHAWINPMRLGTSDQLSQQGDYPIGQWYLEEGKKGTYLVQSGSHWYLNPAYPEVRRLIAEGVTEILEHYSVDGIHIDDYFYPTQDAAFDAAAFEASGAADLAAWRRENCNEMVQEIYAAVKAQDGNLLFGISPQGNMETNYKKLYADTALWCSQEGYCDYIVPQLYYGFDNAVCPFAETAQLWEETAAAADLVIGLAPYKIGQTDQWAGSGSEEWVTDPEVLSKQVQFLKERENVQGIALYSYASLFAPEDAVAALAQAEAERIAEGWRE